METGTNAGLIQIASPSNRGPNVDTYYGNWEPGAAYSPDNDKTAIRGAFGISYFPDNFGADSGTLERNYPETLIENDYAVQSSCNSPYAATAQYSGCGSLVLSDGLPGNGAASVYSPLVVPSGGAPGSGALVSPPPGFGVFVIAKNFRQDEARAWNVSVERQLTHDMVLRAADVGTCGYHLYHDYQLNQCDPPSIVATNPYPGCLPFYGLNPNITTVDFRNSSGLSRYKLTSSDMMLLATPSPRNDASMSAEVHHQCDARSAALILSQLERIPHSSQFHGSELLRNLLSYLTKRAIDRPGEAVKEHDLAVDVLGRDPAFDPRMHSAVRVHTARLRAKLAEYYMAEGADDPFVIEVPKGAYVICWRHRNEHSDEVFHEASAPIQIAPAKRTLHWLSSPGVPAPVQTFWRPFLGSVPDPIVAFSNHRFVGTSASGLHAYHEGVDSPYGINDTYSGTGTVMAVHELNSMFARFHRTIRLKRAELLTWDEARTTNLILIGSLESNSRLRQLPPLEYFDFKSSRAEPRLGVGGIVNLHPNAGEESIYYGSGIPFTSDYAVIAMLAGLKPGQRILVLAGTNTYGVQAAAEFICRADLVGGLLSRLSITRGDSIPDFEALMAVKVNGGVPVDSQLVMVRLRQNPPAGR